MLRGLVLLYVSCCFVVGAIEKSERDLFVTSTISYGPQYFGANGDNLNSVKIGTDGSVWVSGCNSNFVLKLSDSGRVLGNFSVSGACPSVEAIDASGNVWVKSDVDIVTKLSSDGVVLHTFSLGRLSGDIAVDDSGNLWVLYYNSNAVTKVSSTGAVLGTFSVQTPWRIVMDGNGNVWVIVYTSGSVTKLNSNGDTFGTFDVACDIRNGNFPQYLAIDTDENVWVTSPYTGQVTKLSNSGDLLGTFLLSETIYGFLPDLITTDESDHVWLLSYYRDTLVELNSNGTVLGSFALSFEASEMVAINGDGTLWVIGSTNLFLMDTNATMTPSNSLSTTNPSRSPQYSESPSVTGIGAPTNPQTIPLIAGLVASGSALVLVTLFVFIKLRKKIAVPGKGGLEQTTVENVAV